MGDYEFNKMRKLKSIQALRAIAAILVVIDHIFSSAEGLKPGSTLLSEATYHYLGELGVQIFFCISGFIMVHTSNGSSGLAPALVFLKKRIIRIYPIYIITLVVFALVVKFFTEKYNIYFWVDYSSGNIIKRVFLLPTFIYGNGWNNILMQSWTLVYEVYFYMVFAFCIMLVSTKYIPLLATLFILSVMSVVVFIGGREDSNTSTYILNVLGSKNLLFFIFGMLVSFAEKHIARRLILINNSTLFYSLSAILILVSIALKDYVSVYGISISILALMYISTIVEINGDNPINKLMVYLGEASYSLYLVHIFAYIASPYFNVLDINNNIYCSLMSVAAIILGCIVHSYIEKPVVSLLTKSFTYKERKTAA